MISFDLLLYCFVAAGVYLLVVSLIHEWTGQRVKIDRYVPEVLREKMNLSWYLMNYLMDFLFFVAIPTFAFSFFQMVFPLSGTRIGVMVALLSFTLGMVPAFMGLSVRVKLPLPFLLYLLSGLFFKLSGAVIIIGYLYSL